ncbi:Hypothetical Protein FCC1311_065442 [Hondaea fermentalgiana]|uniref:DUF4833 domain-containing protein n=1 Tax=Hondaea fermentalgiana TaxID=2315210 RepID=A0A2R5GIA8_9STRA|nr:Hypothetical Protein FCC1311_065442 [Hondaea fermentalgiana]|eukprot:GBG30325.1 Hypothetical Protein FCC1311_065442 [Hondaea fermentalgiana]
MLAFGDGTVAKPPPGEAAAAAPQVEGFQRALEDLANDPEKYLHPDGQRGALEVDLKAPSDREAAIMLTQMVRGVSRWKPSLVPSKLDEKTFYSNFLSHLVQLANDHFSDERNLEAFYAADDLEAGQREPGVSVELKEFKTENRGESVNVSSGTGTPAAVATPSASSTSVATSASAGSARFSSETAPAGTQGSEMFLDVFLKKNVLFYVSKSENHNVVVYEANLDGSGALDPVNPVNVYWILYARQPCVEEGLTILERNTAYGSTCKPVASRPGHFEMILSAIKTKSIEVWVDEAGALHAQTEISGKMDELLRVSVQSSTNWLNLPKVDYIDLVGAASTERLDNK